MNKTILCAALAGLMGANVTQASAADTMMFAGKEKCYGIAKAGKNDCKSASGAHGCAMMAKSDNNKDEFMMVEIGTCAQQGGSLTPATVPAK